MDNKVISVDPAYRAVQAWKTTNQGFQVDQTKILIQRLVTSSLDAVLHFDKEHVTVIGRI